MYKSCLTSKFKVLRIPKFWNSHNFFISALRRILHRTFFVARVNYKKKGNVENLPYFKIQGATKYYKL